LTDEGKMEDLILGHNWLGRVHQLEGRPFGCGAAERRTIVGALARNAALSPDALFLSETSDEPRAVDYAEAHREVARQASVLVAHGLGRGDRVGVLGHNSIELALVVLSILEAGGVAVLLSPSDPPARTNAQAEFAQARMMLCESSLSAHAGSCAGIRESLTFENLRAKRGEAQSATFPTPAPTDAALVFYTSGTTGAPKAVVQSHFAVAQNAWSLVDHHRIGRETRLLCVLPMHHVNGLEFTIFGALLGGAHTTINKGFDGLRFWDTVARHRIEIASVAPNLLRLLASRPELKGKRPTRLRYLVSAAAPLSTAGAQQVWDRLELRIVQGYGLSEATNFSCLTPTDLEGAEYARWMLEGRRTSIGPALPNQQVQIHRDGRLAQPGEEGEIVIRGHCTMSGYLHNPEATEAMFRDGWVHTGDLGYYLPDADGRKFIHVCGRTKEIAKRGGAMVSLLELDELLAAVPGVADAGATSFPNSWVDEEIGAVVVLRPDAALTEDDILSHCSRMLPYSAMPKRIHFVTGVPRTASGKIRRAEIAEQFAAYREHLFREDRAAWKIANDSSATGL
jgi:long-chain acyl-CoA synthetase